MLFYVCSYLIYLFVNETEPLELIWRRACKLIITHILKK